MLIPDTMLNRRSITAMMAILIFVFICSCTNRNSAGESNDIRVLVIAGGHDFDTTEFINLFRSMDGIEFDLMMQPEANKMISTDGIIQYNALVFYDMWPELDSLAKVGMIHLIDQGIGFIFLHHSICSYQEWDEYAGIVGGRYYTPESGLPDSMLSTYKHGININIKVENGNHPVTRGIADFTIHDEGYGKLQVNDDVEMLISSDHPECSGAMGWVNRYRESDIVYLQPGHDAASYKNPNFKKLLENAIRFVSG